MEFRNRKWILKSRPTDMPKPENFELVEEQISTSDLGPDEILVRNLYTQCAPDQRNWMTEDVNLHPPIPLGATIPAPAMSRIIASSHPQYPEGSLAFTLGGWSDYAIIDVRNLYVPMILYPDTISPLDALAV